MQFCLSSLVLQHLHLRDQMDSGTKEAEEETLQTHSQDLQIRDNNSLITKKNL